MRDNSSILVIPAKAGIQGQRAPSHRLWIPAFAGMTEFGFLPWKATSQAIPKQLGIQYDSDMEARPCVYILASKRNGTLYTGVTRYPIQRVWQHKEDLVRGFTRKYGVHRLVYIELHDTMPAAIQREKQIKEWKRAWKLELIERVNPTWRDLYEDILR